MTPSTPGEPGRSRSDRFRAELRAGSPLDGIVVRTPSHQILEVLDADPTGGPDVVMLDQEHAAFDVVTLDACLAVASALDVPTLVRVGELHRAAVQQALDLGATGVVVPHVITAADARRAVQLAHYGDGGRGFSGSTRSAGWGTRSMAEVLERAAATTTVVVQVEDPGAIDDIDEIVATPGVDAVFVGAADLAVAMGATSVGDPRVVDACDAVLAACRTAGVALAAFAGDTAATDAWRERGVTLVFAGTDQARLR